VAVSTGEGLSQAQFRGLIGEPVCLGINDAQSKKLSIANA
jgi:hypothetical protein